jgi:hypothetical protein
VPADTTFSWPQLLWSITGFAVVIVVLITRRGLIHRRRTARNERPPQKSKLLRPPGYSAQCRAEETFDKLNDALVQALGAGAVAGLSFGPIAAILQGLVLRRFTFSQVIETPHSYMLSAILALGLSAVAYCVASCLLIFRYQDEIRNWRLGARGEQAVAESLADPKLAAAGYRGFHDVPGDGKWNIDHVVVGPGGIFVIETKACVRRKPKWEQQDHIVFFDGKTLRFPWRVDHVANGQAEANARWVRERLAPYAPKDILVQPVIVVPGWWVESQGKFSTKAMNATYLVDYLVSAKRLFAPEQLQQINARLDELCRTVEF